MEVANENHRLPNRAENRRQTRRRLHRLRLPALEFPAISKDGGSMKNRPRKPKGVSMSTVRVVERIVRLGSRAVRRQFVAADRRIFKMGGRCRE